MGQSFINGGFSRCHVRSAEFPKSQGVVKLKPQVDTRSNVDLMGALPGGLRAAVDVSWHQRAKPQ